MQMINDAKQNKFDLIITKEISRFSRNTLDSIKYTRELLSYGVAVLFLNDNINTLLPDSELRLTIMASMAQDEIRRLSERVKFGMQRSIEKGTILGNNKLYGYNKLNNELIINKEESLIVKRLYNLYVINDLSLTKIAKLFNKENIKTNNNNKWSTATLSRMIRNPKYKGYYCGKKTEVTDYINKKIKYLPSSDWITYKDKKIPAIIDEKLWDKANNKINKNKPTNNKNNYLFSNKIYCLHDNHVFHRRNQNNKTSWLCSNYLINGKNNCQTPIIKEDELLHILSDTLINLNIDTTKPITILNNLYNKNIEYQDINNIFYKQLINKITTSLNNNIIYINLYLNLPYQKTNEYTYTSQRGINTKHAKKYKLTYKINYLFTL